LKLENASTESCRPNFYFLHLELNTYCKRPAVFQDEFLCTGE
jgi:hypothetical protein